MLILLLFMCALNNSVCLGQEKIGQICFENSCFSVELAIDLQQRTQGLMFRKQLLDKQGMLFIFPDENIYSFWMKNTLIPLDIIWLNKDKKVVFINENSLPCLALDCPSINPQVEAMYVLEINAETCRKLNIVKGNIARINIPLVLIKSENSYSP